MSSHVITCHKSLMDDDGKNVKAGKSSTSPYLTSMADPFSPARSRSPKGRRGRRGRGGYCESVDRFGFRLHHHSATLLQIHCQFADGQTHGPSPLCLFECLAEATKCEAGSATDRCAHHGCSRGESESQIGGEEVSSADSWSVPGRRRAHPASHWMVHSERGRRHSLCHHHCRYRKHGVNSVGSRPGMGSFFPSGPGFGLEQLPASSAIHHGAESFDAEGPTTKLQDSLGGRFIGGRSHSQLDLTEVSSEVCGLAIWRHWAGFAQMCGSGCGIAQLRQSYQQEHRFVDPVDQVAWRSCFSRLLKMVLQELERHDVVFFAPHLIPGPCWSISVRCLKRSFACTWATSHICRHMLQVWPRILDLWCPSLTKLWNCPSNAFGGQLCNCRFNGGNHFGTCTSDLWKDRRLRTPQGKWKIKTKKKTAVICYQAGKGREHANMQPLRPLHLCKVRLNLDPRWSMSFGWNSMRVPPAAACRKAKRCAGWGDWWWLWREDLSHIRAKDQPSIQWQAMMPQKS